MNTMHVAIVSAEKELFSGDVTFFAGTSISGELGIFPGHLPLLTQLVPGQVRLKTTNGSEDVFWISGGILEIQPNQIIVLAESAERADDLDEAEAKAARERVESMLQKQNDDFNFAKAQTELREINAKIDAIERYRKIGKI
ncbi:F0F1 ATP synthase subunit epsilon [Wohlfahrtiimonas populi]|uniref:F0F1 ATP synthase subunit epsilon n=1 Tax=Wohlfahrtiimonas populi TaxID=1940240 RepID=UPI00098D4440|nr:F0F1 ATP synthase subunit epsilon [Wohlfahrtiimonas populi]